MLNVEHRSENFNFRCSLFSVRYFFIIGKLVKKKKQAKVTPPTVKPEGVEFYFDKFAAAHQNPVTKLLYITFIPLLVLSLFGIAWVIPFPYIKFLGQYNQDFNWSSFLLAAMVYYYLRLSPVLAYVMLFILLVYFYMITSFLQVQKGGTDNLALVSLVFYTVSCIVLFIGYIKEGKRLSWEYRIKNILIAPVFLLHLVLRRFKVKY